MKIGLTGARGVLGRRLTSELSRDGHDVVHFDGDVRDAEMVQNWAHGLDAIIHAAAVVPVQTVLERLNDAIAINVAGAANVARSVDQLTGCRLIYLSTSHVYALKATPLSETDPTHPSSLYGLTKLQGEQWVQCLTAKHLIIRIFSFFDAYQQPPFLVPSLRQRIMSAEPNAVLDLRSASSVRDIVDGQWVARVCTMLVNKQHTGVVNCGTGKGLTVQQIAQALAEALGRRDITWRSTVASADDTVIADAQVLQEYLGELPPFDLTAALSRCAASWVDSATAHGGQIIAVH
jgi:nucleoside-diphosphate-sugar epimerase